MERALSVLAEIWRARDLLLRIPKIQSMSLDTMERWIISLSEALDSERRARDSQSYAGFNSISPPVFLGSTLINPLL